MSVEKGQKIIRITDQTKNRWGQLLFVVFICGLACGFYYYFFVNKAYVEMELSVAQKSDFKVYWAAGDQLYSEKNMAVVIATPERQKYTFFLPSASKITRLRIDTHNYLGEATLNKLVIQQEGYVPVNLTTAEQFKALVPLFDIEEWRVDNDGLWLKSKGEDPNFELMLSPEKQAMDIGWLVLRLLAIGAIVAGAIYGAWPLAAEWRIVPVLLFGIWLLIIAMAGISKENAHPDEYVHLSAASYYKDNWLPPAIDDPAIRDSYSVYGMSRLNNGEVYYLFAGKIAKFAESLRIPDYFSLRLLNVCLFGLIFLYTVRNRYARMAALPLLISSQPWYLFSYCASDAFALFVAFLAVCELIDPESLLHRYLKGDGWFTKIAGAVVLGVLLGIVFLLKKNYYPFVIFFYFCLALKIFWAEQFFWEKKEAVLRLMLITLIGLGVLGLRVGADYLVNGFDRQEKIVTMQKEMADSLHNPNTELNNQHIWLHLKARGTTLTDLIRLDRWFERSFQTAFGVYGYFTISGTQGYYDLVRWSGVVLAVFFFSTVFLRGGVAGSAQTVAALMLAAGLIGASLYQSWTADFQAQGRYLFSILPMLGILYGLNHEAVNRRFFLVCLTPLIVLGVYSFIFEGLMRIPKVISS